MTTLTLTKVKAHDHFTSEDDKGKHPKRCIVYYIGEICEEDELYLTIRSNYTLFQMDDGTFTKEKREYLANVLKTNIIKRKDVEMEWDEDEDE
jgi:hypothetical protein